MNKKKIKISGLLFWEFGARVRANSKSNKSIFIPISIFATITRGLENIGREHSKYIMIYHAEKTEYLLDPIRNYV